MNQPGDVTAAAKAGVDALITDDPLMALGTLDKKPAAVKLDPLAHKLAKVRRKRRLPVRVSTDEAATVKLVARLRGKVLGRRTVEFDDAGKERVVIKLTRKGRRALKARDEAKVKLVARSTDLALNRGKVRTSAPLG